MTRGRWRLGVARWLASTVGEVPPEPAPHTAPVPAPQPVPALPEGPVPAGTEPAAGLAADPAAETDAWKGVCEQFALRLLTHAEQLRPALDELESDEGDPDRLEQLYNVDHGIARIRRAACDLRVLTGREGEEIAGHTTSMLDVIRMAMSSIEHYGQVSIGTVAELAVVAYAADDVAYLLAALADNATRYSPSQVTISAHLMGDGGVLVRVEDAGFGIRPDWLASLNAALAGPVPPVDARTGTHTGLAVAHRLARKHGVSVQLACRQPPGPGAQGGTGTIAMVTIGPQLLCELPVAGLAGLGGPAAGGPAAGGPVAGGPAPGGGLSNGTAHRPAPGAGPTSGSTSGPVTGAVTGPEASQRVWPPRSIGPTTPARSLGPAAPIPSAPPGGPPRPFGRPAGSGPGGRSTVPLSPGSPDESRPAFRTVNGLPQRERASLRGSAPAPAAGRERDRSAEDTAHTGRSFAADVAAFTAGEGAEPPDPAAPMPEAPGGAAPPASSTGPSPPDAPAPASPDTPDDRPEGPEGRMPR